MTDGDPTDAERPNVRRASGSYPTREEELSMAPIGTGAVVSLVLAFLLGWIPVVGAAIAGFVGGTIAGTRIRGIYATFPAGIMAMVHFWFITYLPDLPFAWADRLEGVLAPVSFILRGASGVLFALLFMGSFLVTVVAGFTGGLLAERERGRTSVGRRGAKPS